MPRTYVSLDLETTGLDPDRDAIMEVGAVRFSPDGGHCETFSTFVNPGRHVPYRIQRLTGISDDDLAGAPLFAEVAADLEAFIGDSPIIGQNVGFDLDFLERNLLRPPGPRYDTQEIATLLCPDLLEHNLRAIAAHLGVEYPVQHRALADAEAARRVFLALRERLKQLPSPLLDEAERLASITDWPLRHLLREVSDEIRAGPEGAETGLIHGAVRKPQPYGPPVEPDPEGPYPIDTDAIERLLSHAGRTAIEAFEERPEQVAMARAVAAALNDGERLLVEAGTGVGKSIAYLLPAAQYALRNGARVVVSTNTINLQEQLLGQDIPNVRRLLAGDPDARNLRVTQLKGRRNYLCLLRWASLRQSPSLSAAEARLLVKLLLWLPHTDTGDRSEIRLDQDEEPVWSKLNAANQGCLSTGCPFVRDGSCFLLRARRRAEAAHILVVNHALLLSDVAVGGGVIPDYQHLVIDEAHHLESEATEQFGFYGREGDLTALLDRAAARNAGLVAELRGSVRGFATQTDAGRRLLDLAGDLETAVGAAKERLPDFFLRLAGFVRQQQAGPGDYDNRLLLTRAVRVQPDWADVEMAWENVGATLGRVLAFLQAIYDALQAPDAETLPDRDSLEQEALDLLQTGMELRAGMGEVILKDDPERVCWLTEEQRSGGGIGLAAAPLRVSDILEQRLFSQKDAAVLTSATLTAENRFDYLKRTLGLEDARELQLGSPFDYANSTVVLVPQDMPEPNQHGYMAALQQALIEMTRASRGRALVLFTSHASLRAAYHGIAKPLEQEGILVLGHHIDGSPRHLIQALKEHPHTVVLGTASFWEGVDVVGEALSLLVIARLPFSVPNDPVFQARSELYDDPFNEYAVPQAVLRFKQGFGRLIRRKTDRGAMVVLDSRVQTKRYGQTFLRSLPACTVKRVPLRELPGLVGDWLATDDTP